MDMAVIKSRSITDSNVSAINQHEHTTRHNALEFPDGEMFCWRS